MKLDLTINRQEQLAVANSPFRSEKDILVFQNDLSTAAHSRPGWDTLLILQGKDKQFKNIIYEYQMITDTEIDDYYIHRYQNETKIIKQSARNMYVALYMTLSSKVRSRLSSLKTTIKYDGPTEIYHLLKTYSGDAQPTIRFCIDKLSKLDLSIYNYNIQDFATETEQLIETLMNSGGTDTKGRSSRTRKCTIWYIKCTIWYIFILLKNYRM